MTGKLQPDEVTEIARLREERGWSYRRLAGRFGVSTGAIQYQCLRQGAVSPRSRAQRSRGPMVMQARDGRLQRRFTEAEDACMLELAGEGVGIADIGRRMGRPRSSIRMRLLALGLREEGYAQAGAPA